MPSGNSSPPRAAQVSPPRVLSRFPSRAISEALTYPSSWRPQHRRTDFRRSGAAASRPRWCRRATSEWSTSRSPHQLAVAAFQMEDGMCVPSHQIISSGQARGVSAPPAYASFDPGPRSAATLKMPPKTGRGATSSARQLGPPYTVIFPPLHGDSPPNSAGAIWYVACDRAGSVTGGPPPHRGPQQHAGLHLRAPTGSVGMDGPQPRAFDFDGGNWSRARLCSPISARRMMPALAARDRFVPPCVCGMAAPPECPRASEWSIRNPASILLRLAQPLQPAAIKNSFPRLPPRFPRPHATQRRMQIRGVE